MKRHRIPSRMSGLRAAGSDVAKRASAVRPLLAIFGISLSLQSGLAQEPRAQRGLIFVQTNCASCHAIRQTDPSPLAIAPPLRDLHKRYPIADLAESSAEGIVTGHPTMPQFQLDGAQIGDLIAYFETLER